MQNKNYSAVNEKEIINNVFKNFEKITGYQPINCINFDEESSNVFNEDMIDETIQSITEYVKKEYNINILKEGDNMLILLDDKLTDLRWKCIKTRRNTNENY
jgi:hypothetical protein